MSNQRINHYKNLGADYSRPGRVTPEQSKGLIADAERFIALREKQVPPITADYPLDRIERENKEWWPATSITG